MGCVIREGRVYEVVRVYKVVRCEVVRVYEVGSRCKVRM